MTVAIKKSTSLNKLNLTPMIDVVFQLLIFFLVAARFEEEERQFPINLPNANEAQARTAKVKELFIHVERNGAIHVGGNQVTRDGLLKVLKEAKANIPWQTVIIRGDEDCDFKHIVTAMDVCHEAGFEKPMVGTKQASAAGT